jgi:hypothetical protein
LADGADFNRIAEAGFKIGLKIERVPSH